MYINKYLVELPLEEFDNNELHISFEDMHSSPTFLYHDMPMSILLNPSHQGSLMAMEQVMLLGHFLYYKNEPFRREYIRAMGREMRIRVKNLKEIFVSSIFNTLFYGIVVAQYVEKMSPLPMYYMHRLINDERCPEQGNFFKKEREMNPQYVYDKNGSPFCTYSRRKSIVITPPPYIPHDEKSITVICPIKSLIPLMKQFMDVYKKLAEVIFSRLLSMSDDDKLFTKTFTDPSWTPIIENQDC